MDKQKKILILPGDGIGPEVCQEAKRVLIHINETHNLGIKLEEAAVGGRAYEAVSYTHLTLPTIYSV